MIPIVKDNIQQIKNLCETHQVEALYLFGSAAKGLSKKNSDLDFLVRFSDSVDLLDYADNYFDLLGKLQKLFNRDIDLVSERSLKNPVLIQEINKSKISLYEH
ncbi:MAG: nucleotidyltransferase domain-containing protein [Chitinophagales bacterium]